MSKQEIIDNYNNRFNNERYSEAIEWLANVNLNNEGFACENRAIVTKVVEGAALAIAQIFNQVSTRFAMIRGFML